LGEDLIEGVETGTNVEETSVLVFISNGSDTLLTEVMGDNISDDVRSQHGDNEDRGSPFFLDVTNVKSEERGVNTLYSEEDGVESVFFVDDQWVVLDTVTKDVEDEGRAGKESVEEEGGVTEPVLVDS